MPPFLRRSCYLTLFLHRHCLTRDRHAKGVGKFRNKMLANLIGYYYDGDERLLVTEFMPNDTHFYMYDNLVAQPGVPRPPTMQQPNPFGNAFYGVGSGLISDGLGAYGEKILGSSSEYIQSNISRYSSDPQYYFQVNDQYQGDISSYINDSIKNGIALSTFRKDKLGGDGIGISYWMMEMRLLVIDCIRRF
ncbi:uncharacterized protein LOC116005190 [Ipomoea triloba]|uniref:uncharacterized protein LOC116005190 n=1 Tax=Ipomoea triloba TaxID=35885 RepID=UPI00125D052D|nr:uncharacterized protein LOC116005190 [Ipomoea triloba]